MLSKILILALLCAAIAQPQGSGNATALQGRLISPTAPTNGQVLGWVGATSRWTPTTASGGGTPASPANSIQFNNAGSFGGSANLTWDGSSLSIGTKVTLDGTTNGITTASSIGGVLLSGLSGYGFFTAGVPSAISPTFAALTDGSTVTWAIGSAILANAVLTFTVHSGSRTLNITGAVNGGSYVLKLIQDGTGGEGLVLGTGCTWKVSNGGAGAVTLTSSAAAIDMLAFTYDGTNCLVNYAPNFN